MHRRRRISGGLAAISACAVVSRSVLGRSISACVIVVACFPWGGGGIELSYQRLFFILFHQSLFDQCLVSPTLLADPLVGGTVEVRTRSPVQSRRVAKNHRLTGIVERVAKATAA